MKRRFTAAALAVLLVTGSLYADIRVKSNFKMEGLVGLMNMEGTVNNLISGDKAKTINNMKMTSKVMKSLGAGKPNETAEITRLDKELFWELEMKDKKYKEQTFAQARADIEKSLADNKKSKEKRLKDHPEDSLSFKTTFTVDKTGKSEIIAGHNADQYFITIETYGKSSEGGEGRMKIELDTWLAKDVGGDEYKRFYATLFEKLGFTGRSRQSLEGALMGLGIDPNDVKVAVKDLEGVALRSITTVTLVGEDEQGQEESAPLLTFNMEVTEVATGAIPAIEFEVPEGFKLKK
ncbi:MAG: hypothetical protein WBP29_07990 [Candidatus Zixiibacteriota bacterium]